MHSTSHSEDRPGKQSGSCRGFIFSSSVKNNALPDHQKTYKVREIGSSFSSASHSSKHPIPTDTPVFDSIVNSFDTKPNKNGLTYNMIIRDKPPKPTVLRFMSVISHHPIIILFKGILISQIPIDSNF